MITKLKATDFTFTESGKDITRVLEEKAPRKVSAEKKPLRYKETMFRSFPCNKFRKIGASVYSYANGFVVDFSRVIIAASLDDEFIQNILNEVPGNDLIKAPSRSVWTIRKVGSKKFFITRKEV